MARSSASEPRITLVMGFGGDADVDVVRDVSMLRIERGSGDTRPGSLACLAFMYDIPVSAGRKQMGRQA